MTKSNRQAALFSTYLSGVYCGIVFLMLTKEQKRNQWMQKFEDKCLEAGVSYETIHGIGHTNFWNAANFYYSYNLDVEIAVTRYLIAHPVK